MSCPLCGGGASRPFSAFAGVWLRCRDCGGASLAGRTELPMPAPPSPDHSRERVDPAADRELLRARAQAVRRLAPGRRLLDISARDGGFVAAARSLGLDAIGVESSADARAAARGRGVELEAGPIDALGASFHAVTLWDVIPHVTHPGELLSAVRRQLVPGGIVAVATPNGAGLGARRLRRRFPMLDFPSYGHFHQVTGPGLLALFDRAGLTPIGLSSRGLHGGDEATRRAGPLGQSVRSVLAPVVETLGLGEAITAFARR